MSQGVVDRVIIVTGGGGGIGRGLIRHLGSVGAKVVVAEINEDSMRAAVGDLEAMSVECLGVITDILDRESIRTMVDATIARFGRVDGLVNNARVPARTVSLIEHNDEDWDINFDSAAKATLWAMQAVYPHMKGAGWGRIVNVGSNSGLIGWKGMGAYGAAKEAVRSLTRTAAREWAVDGIVVNCYVPSSLFHHRDDYPTDKYTAESVAVFKGLLPAGNVDTVGNPETDIAPVVAFLLSDECRYLTGQTLTLSGGAFAFA